ncbi:MAG TPA: hypothetical protein PLK30_02005 [Blastocatellia bacterium]|nr:hypothetical protein [Blastocatellia bacterium]
MLLESQKLLLFSCVVTFGFFMHCFSIIATAKASRLQSSNAHERERDRTYARQQFTKNFRDLQETSQSLLKEHENKRLTSERLTKDVRSINKSAKTLRSLMALGNLAVPMKIDKEIKTPQQFDKSIRRLAKHIYDFAHNPIHQSSKVFNTDQAQQAQTDLLAIIDLSKALEEKAKGYALLPESP